MPRREAVEYSVDSPANETGSKVRPISHSPERTIAATVSATATITRKVTRGRLCRICVIAVGINSAANPSATAMATSPIRAPLNASICRRSLMCSSDHRLRQWITSSPLLVSLSPLGIRSKSGVPSISSALSICRSIAEAAMFSRSAALRIEPCRTTSSKYAEKREKNGMHLLTFRPP